MLPESGTPTSPDAVAVGGDLLRSGQITEALRVLTGAPERGADPHRTVARLAGLLECHLARGELGHATATGVRLQPWTDEPGRTGAVTEHALGELASARGNAEASAAHHLRAGEHLTGCPAEPDTIAWQAGAALALARMGRRSEAHRLALDHLAAARGCGSSYAVALGLRTVAATISGGGRVGLLREARAALSGIRADRLAAQLDTDLAVLLTLQGDPTANEEAVRLLRGAEEFAGREDLFPLQQRVRRVLERLGEHPRRIRSEALAALTSTEQRAARLAADGLTNRQIAESLSVTVKAVEWHLSHVYRKLGIRSRTSLAESLGVPA